VAVSETYSDEKTKCSKRIITVVNVITMKKITVVVHTIGDFERFKKIVKFALEIPTNRDGNGAFLEKDI
jgi:hypothetical protein